jgi:hypothetical protein
MFLDSIYINKKIILPKANIFVPGQVQMQAFLKFIELNIFKQPIPAETFMVLRQEFTLSLPTK